MRHQYEVILDEIKIKNGIGKNKNSKVYDWKSSIGKTIKIINDENIVYKFKIKDYETKNSMLRLINESNEEFNMKTSNLINSKVSVLVGDMNKNFKLNINDIINSNGRDLVISDKKIKNNRRYYTCKCRKCKGSFDIWERHLLVTKSNCPYCAGKKVLVGFNDLSTIRPDLIKYLKYPSDGNKYSELSGKSILVKCPYCGYEKNMTIAKLSLNGFSCPRCSDDVSYSEKFLMNVLEQLSMNYTYQLSKKKQRWCGSFIYDFYLDIDNKKVIIETNGIQHYEENGLQKLGNYTFVEQQENDYIKRQLALSNGIDYYIELDCRKSNIQWIKNSIMTSKLPEILSFIEEDIEWNKCEEFTATSFVKKACEIKLEHPEYSNEKIGELINRSIPTVISYLKRGKAIGWLK